MRILALYSVDSLANAGWIACGLYVYLTSSQSCWYSLFPVLPPVSLYGIFAAIH
ncbi:hypothetical protein BD779DRAFT_21411 [Infundibulicybe gibba]|nr:hypothetical protein BD779DRAFT_21411 [Infundibulicybe gibba]